MNVGPVDTSIPSMPVQSGGEINSASGAEDSNGGNVGVGHNAIPNQEDEERSLGGAPQPLKQMSTSDFLTLHQTFNDDNVMDKMAKIFEAILALKLLEETLENINKSTEERLSEGE